MKRKAISACLVQHLLPELWQAAVLTTVIPQKALPYKAQQATAQKVRTAVMARPKETPNTRTLLQLMYLTAWQTIRESSLAGLQKS